MLYIFIYILYVYICACVYICNLKHLLTNWYSNTSAGELDTITTDRIAWFRITSYFFESEKFKICCILIYIYTCTYMHIIYIQHLLTNAHFPGILNSKRTQNWLSIAVILYLKIASVFLWCHYIASGAHAFLFIATYNYTCINIYLKEMFYRNKEAIKKYCPG